MCTIRTMTNNELSSCCCCWHREFVYNCFILLRRFIVSVLYDSISCYYLSSFSLQLNVCFLEYRNYFLGINEILCVIEIFSQDPFTRTVEMSRYTLVRITVFFLFENIHKLKKNTNISTNTNANNSICHAYKTPI